MLIAMGRDLYGKTERYFFEGQEEFYVKTLFTHINLIPIAPLQSYVVLAGTENGAGDFAGFPIPTSRKSVFHAYLRTLFAIILFFAGVMGMFTACIEDIPGTVMYGSVIVTTLGAWY